MFEGTLEQLVILAVFLPVMAGQTGNTGCQALAVTLRGMTLGELKPGFVGRLVAKEGLLGLCNGLLVGITAGARHGCLRLPAGRGAAAGDGPRRPVRDDGELHRRGHRRRGRSRSALKRLGADPATASSIFLTTASDVASMGVFLSLATILLM